MTGRPKFYVDSFQIEPTMIANFRIIDLGKCSSNKTLITVDKLASLKTFLSIAHRILVHIFKLTKGRRMWLFLSADQKSASADTW